MSAHPNGVTPLHAPAAEGPAPEALLVHNATNIADVRAALSILNSRETSITQRLDSLLGSQSDLSRDLGRLDHLRAALGAQVIATRAIGSGMLSMAADTAGHLSNKVKQLDLEKERVEQTLGVVEQVAELRACVHGVVGSMGAPQDWEAAASYISRASKVPDGIISGGFAASIVPSVEVPDPPWVTLENAKESLCGLFLREFEKAAKDGDDARVTRFFKLFPLIGRGDVGLDVYGRYVCHGVAGTARETLRQADPSLGAKEGYFYANSLTKLFQHIAHIIEGHGSLVERHYGPGKMIKVIERLQMEADVQGGIILDSWGDARSVDRRLTDVKSYPFSFLVQSFLPAQRGPTSRMNSPATGIGSNNPRSSEDEGVDMKEVDTLLNEISVMLSRWSLYARFLAEKCKDASQDSDTGLIMPDVLIKSNLSRKVSAKLSSPYNVMSTFFFRRSVEKAFQLDESPSGLSLNLSKPINDSPPYIILAVDDVVFIVDNLIQKTLATSQRDISISTISTIGRVLGSDFVGMVQRKMRDESYPKALVQGGLPPEDKIVAFIVLINSLDMANQYLARVVSNNLGRSSETPHGIAGGSSPLRGLFPFGRDSDLVENALQNLLTTFTSKTTELLNEGLHVLFHNVVKIRLRPIISDAFRDVDYQLSEDELAEVAQQNDENEEDLLEQVTRRFEHGWGLLTKPLRRIMTEKTFNALLDITAKHLARVLEKRVWSLSGRTNAYGAIRMERDFSGIVSTISKGNYEVRELFTRVTQILMITNMEEEEWEELAGGVVPLEDDIQWVVSEAERRRARAIVNNGQND